MDSMSATDLIADAERAVSRLREMSADLRECAILNPSGELLAASSEGSWEACAAALWEAASESPGPPPVQVHVAIEEGEVFAARTPAGVAVAVADRFALGSLMFCDLRAALRGLEAAPAGAAEG
jgi:hypothetical protein